MSASWSSPDARRLVTGTAFGARVEGTEQVAPPVRLDVLAGLVTVAVTVLAGAPVGLLWAALAPRPAAVLTGEVYLRADPSSSAYIAGDGFFLAAMLLAGIVTGLLAWRFARAHGPAVVAGLGVGGLVAAFTAMRVGELLFVTSVAEAVARRAPTVELPLSLTANEALAGWAAAALVVYIVLTLLRSEG